MSLFWVGINYASVLLCRLKYSCIFFHILLHIHDTLMCEMDIGNPKYNTLRLLSSGKKLLFTFLSLKVFRHEERERENLSMLTAFTSSALNPTNARRP